MENSRRQRFFESYDCNMSSHPVVICRQTGIGGSVSRGSMETTDLMLNVLRVQFFFSKLVQEIRDGTNMTVLIDSLFVFVLNHAIILRFGP